MKVVRDDFFNLDTRRVEGSLSINFDCVTWVDSFEDKITIWLNNNQIDLYKEYNQGKYTYDQVPNIMRALKEFGFISNQICKR